jgi:hypothetical protein
MTNYIVYKGEVIFNRPVTIEHLYVKRCNFSQYEKSDLFNQYTITAYLDDDIVKHFIGSNTNNNKNNWVIFSIYFKLKHIF